MVGKRARVCTSIGVERIEELKRCIDEAFRLGSDLIEVRVDFLRGYEPDALKEAVEDRLDQCIMTCRPKDQGGRFGGDEEERVEVLKGLSSLRPAFLDIELSLAKDNPGLLDVVKAFGPSVIASWHDFTETPSYSSLKERLAEALSHGEYAKIVPMARSLSDNINTLRLYESTSAEKLIAFCMGEKGVISRVLCGILGSPITYASLPSSPIAPAQLSVKEMREFLDLFSGVH